LAVRDLGSGNVLLQFAKYAPDRPFLVLGTPLATSSADQMTPLFAVVAPVDDLAQKFAESGIVVRCGPEGFNVEITDGELLKGLLG
jgi:hypothetical protein